MSKKTEKKADQVRGAFHWIDRWRLSPAYTDLGLAEQGAMRNLMDELWLRLGRLPKEDRALGRISGDPIEWPKVRDRVLAQFYEAPDGLGNTMHDEWAAGSPLYISSQQSKGKARARTARRGPAGKFVRDSDGPVQPPLPGLEPSEPFQPAQHQPEPSRLESGWSARLDQPSQPSVAGAGGGAVAETETDERTPPTPLPGGSDPEGPNGDGRTDSNGPDEAETDDQADDAEAVEPIDTGEILALIDQELAPKWIAAGGLADRSWRRRVKAELRARGIEAGRAVILEEIAAQKRSRVDQERERAEREQAAAQRSSADRATRMLIAQAKAGGRGDGRAEWAGILQATEAELNRHAVGTWLRPLVPLGILTDDEGDRLLIGAPSEQFLAWVQRNYRAALERAAEAAGHPGLTVQVLLMPETEVP